MIKRDKISDEDWDLVKEIPIKSAVEISKVEQVGDYVHMTVVYPKPEPKYAP